MPKKAKITLLPRQAASDHIELGRLQERAIERGERLEKIARIIDKWRSTSEEGYGVIKQIYRLAKGEK